MDMVSRGSGVASQLFLTRRTHDIEHKADKPVMRRKGEQHSIHQQNMLEIVDDALSIQEIHRRGQEIPIERLCKPQVLRSARNVGDSYDLLEGHNLDSCDQDNKVEVAGKEGHEEPSNHYKRPYRPGNKSLFLLLVIGELSFGGTGFLQIKRSGLVSFILSTPGVSCKFRTSFATSAGLSELASFVGLGGSERSLTSVELYLAGSFVLRARDGNRTFLFGLAIMIRNLSSQLTSGCFQDGRAEWEALKLFVSVRWSRVRRAGEELDDRQANNCWPGTLLYRRDVERRCARGDSGLMDVEAVKA